MKIEEQTNEITEEASDTLGSRDSQEEQDEDWSPEDLSSEQRQQYERGVAAVDEFLNDERTARYKATDSNQEKLLAFLEDHDLPLSFGGLYVAFEQLSEGGELELKSEQEDQGADEEQSDASARLATAGLARGNQSGEEEETNQEPPALEEPKTARGKPVVGWRNGKRVFGVGS